jgi:hypothetical protein
LENNKTLPTLEPSTPNDHPKDAPSEIAVQQDSAESLKQPILSKRFEDLSMRQEVLDDLEKEIAQTRVELHALVQEIVKIDPKSREVLALVARGAGRYIGSKEDNELWADFAMAIKEDEDANRELEEMLSVCGEEGAYAASFGMIAGMMYASLTGITLPLKTERSN